MRIISCLLSLLVGILIVGNVQIAFGNGRTTPPPSDALPLNAICNQSEGGQLEIFRVRLIEGDGVGETLKVSTGEDIAEISLRKIKQLKFLTTKVNADGFMKAEIIGTDNAEVTPAMIQVRSSDTAIRLTGFTSKGTSVGVDLLKCQAVAFSLIHKGSTDLPSRGVTEH